MLFSNVQNEKNFSFSYVFCGRSYPAMKKFRKDLYNLGDSEQFLDTVNKLCEGPILEARMNFVECLNNIFLK